MPVSRHIRGNFLSRFYAASLDAPHPHSVEFKNSQHAPRNFIVLMASELEQILQSDLESQFRAFVDRSLCGENLAVRILSGVYLRRVLRI